MATVVRNSNVSEMKPVDILKKGLTKLQHQIRDRKTRLENKLKASQQISDIDQEWLDHAGNLVDEERVIDALDHANLSSGATSLVQQTKIFSSQ